MTSDPSFHSDALFGSNAWAARRLGMSKDRFFRKRDELEAAGFPKPDRLTGRYIKADVDQWVERRRQIGAPVTTEQPHVEKGRPNLHEL